MSCRVAVRRDDGTAVHLTRDQAVTLLDLALDEDEVTFKELARCLGVGVDRVDDLWTQAQVMRALSTRASSRSGPRRRREDWRVS